MFITCFFSMGKQSGRADVHLVPGGPVRFYDFKMYNIMQVCLRTKVLQTLLCYFAIITEPPESGKGVYPMCCSAQNCSTAFLAPLY